MKNITEFNKGDIITRLVPNKIDNIAVVFGESIIKKQTIIHL